MNKQSRHKVIQEVISTNEISNQDILLNMLINKGYDITQATLSRDIKEMQVVKVPTASGGYAYQLPRQQSNVMQGDNRNMLTFGSVTIEFSGNLAVIKTRPGYAMAIAGEIDEKASKTILGTVAGDDTILIIPRENIERTEIMKSLAAILPNIERRY